MKDLSEFMPSALAPELDAIMSYKSIYVLATVDREGRALKGTHYAACLVSGPSPVWGVWTIRSRFLRFYTYRSQIEDAYPKLVWRRKMATWSCVDLSDKSVEMRRAELEMAYRKTTPKLHDEPVG